MCDIYVCIYVWIYLSVHSSLKLQRFLNLQLDIIHHFDKFFGHYLFIYCFCYDSLLMLLWNFHCIYTKSVCPLCYSSVFFFYFHIFYSPIIWTLSIDPSFGLLFVSSDVSNLSLNLFNFVYRSVLAFYIWLIFYLIWFCNKVQC